MCSSLAMVTNGESFSTCKPSLYKSKNMRPFANNQMKLSFFLPKYLASHRMDLLHDKLDQFHPLHWEMAHSLGYELAVLHSARPSCIDSEWEHFVDFNFCSFRWLSKRFHSSHCLNAGFESRKCEIFSSLAMSTYKPVAVYNMFQHYTYRRHSICICVFVSTYIHIYIYSE